MFSFYFTHTISLFTVKLRVYQFKKPYLMAYNNRCAAVTGYVYRVPQATKIGNRYSGVFLLYPFPN